MTDADYTKGYRHGFDFADAQNAELRAEIERLRSILRLLAKDVPALSVRIDEALTAAYDTERRNNDRG